MAIGLLRYYVVRNVNLHIMAFHSAHLTTSVCWAMAEKEKIACNFQLFYHNKY